MLRLRRARQALLRPQLGRRLRFAVDFRVEPFAAVRFRVLEEVPRDERFVPVLRPPLAAETLASRAASRSTTSARSSFGAASSTTSSPLSFRAMMRSSSSV